MASTLLTMQKTVFRLSLGRRAPEGSRLFFVLLQSILRPDLSLEIGAHEATFSQLMRNCYSDLPILACEANPVVFSHYKSQIDFKKHKISYINKAVSDTDGTIKFNILNENNGISGRSSILERDYSAENIMSKKVTVDSIRGDSLIQSFRANNAALWIDVEGAASIVLSGLQKSLEAKRISSIYIEVETIAYWQEQQLEQHVLETLINYDYIPILCDGEYTYQQNIIFVRKEEISEQFFAAAHDKYMEALTTLFHSPTTPETAAGKAE